MHQLTPNFLNSKLHEKPANRLVNIDSLRGFAALAVLWFHLTNTVNNYPVSQFLRDSGAYGWIGVDVFFVISGFIIPYSFWRANFVFIEHWRIFIVKRVIRIEPTYLVSILFTVGIGLIVNVFYAKSIYTYEAVQIAAHFLYLNAFLGFEWINPVYWTLAIEFQFYILIGLLYRILLSKNGRELLVLGAFLLAYLVQDANFIFKYAGLFLIGMFAFVFYIEKITKTRFVLLLCSSLALSYLNLGVIASTTGLFTCFFILFMRLPELKWLTFLGSISYSLYLFHYPIVEKLIRYGKHLGMGLLEQLIVSIATLLVSVFVASIFYKVVEKPTLNISSKIKY